MRKKFISILVALCMLANLCGCAAATSNPAPTVSATSEVAAENGTTGAPAAELAGESVRNTQANQDERGNLGFDEETDTDASAGASEEDGSSSVTPPVVDPEPEPEPQPEPEPEPEVVAPEHGQYSYTVGDTTVYTEHDIERWLTPDEYPGDFILSLGQMLGEVWQMSGMDNAAGYSFYDGDESKWLSFDDEDDSHIDHTVTMSWLADGTESSVTISMANYRDEDPCFYIVGSRIYAIDKELAVLILLTAERIEEDPNYFTLEDLDLGPNFDVSY